MYAAQDNNDSLDGRRKLLHTASGGGYNITTPVELLATEQDNDKQLFIHDGNYNGITTLFVPEGGTARYVHRTAAKSLRARNRQPAGTDRRRPGHRLRH